MNVKTAKRDKSSLSPLILDYLLEIKTDLNNDGIEKIGLFGSYAKGTASDDSDVDIAIELKKDYLEKHDVWEYFTLVDTIKSRMADKFHKRIDIFDLESQSETRQNILKEIIYV